MLNMMCAMRIVTGLSGKNGGPPIDTNIVSRLAPSTISGVAIGMKMSGVRRAAQAELVADQRERR